ncbi:MAG: ATP-binding protein [Acidimicrobiales bacterium]
MKKRKVLRGAQIMPIHDGGGARSAPAIEGATGERGEGTGVGRHSSSNGVTTSFGARIASAVREAQRSEQALSNIRDTDADRILLSAIIDSTDDAVISVDLKGRITSWNRGAEELYGVSLDEAISAKLDEVLPAMALEIMQILRDAGGDRIVHREVERSRLDNVKVLVDETVSPLRNFSGELVGAAAISRDIGPRRKIEEALALTRRELEVRNQLLERSNTELEQFAYIASHDISEPLRAVAGMVGLLERRYKGQLDEQADEFIAFAVDGCARMQVMIEDLLSFSRAGSEELHLEHVSLETVVEEISDALSTQIFSSNASLTLINNPTLEIDRLKFTQALQNIVSNALKYRRSDLDPVVEITARELGVGRWRIEVADNGIGIAPGHRARVFKMFQRLHTRDEYPGTGIGLAITKRLVEAHGGEIGIADNESGGTTVWITIPGSKMTHES